MVEEKLRILFVSGYFPPKAPIGAVRTGKLAEYWQKLGHEVRTIAIALPSKDDGAGQDPDSSVYYVLYREPGRVVTRMKSALERSKLGRALFKRGRPAEAQPSPVQTPASDAPATVRKLGLVDLYRQILLIPDSYRSWIAPAVRLGLSWQGAWKPDLIYSSGPPHSGHIVATRLASRFGVPWIAELRDLWADDPYFDRHLLLKPIHDAMARRTLGQATACVVVTRTAQARLEKSTDRPVVVSYNGYVADDFAGLDDVEPLDRERLTIIHAGVIYPGRRDPTPLFKAIAALGENAKKIRCLFYHDARKSVATLAAQFGITPSVEIHPAIPRQQILRIERQADILLECRWLDPAGDGVIPGKLFEYIGARRPILSLGSLTGEAAAIVRDNKLGLASNDPEAIKAMLLESLEIKAQLGRLPDFPVSADDAFRRETQFRKIDALIESLLPARKSP